MKVDVLVAEIGSTTTVVNAFQNIDSDDPIFWGQGQAPTSVLEGDVNHDGEVNIADINTLIDIVLAGSTDNPDADVNHDGEVNIADINTLIDIVLSK